MCRIIHIFKFNVYLIIERIYNYESDIQTLYKAGKCSKIIQKQLCLLSPLHFLNFYCNEKINDFPYFRAPFVHCIAEIYNKELQKLILSPNGRSKKKKHLLRLITHVSIKTSSRQVMWLSMLYEMYIGGR